MSKRQWVKATILGGAFGIALAALGLRKPAIEHHTPLQLQPSSAITVMTANIARGEGKDFSPFTLFSEKPKPGIQALEELITQEKVDLACFQEIEHTPRGEHQPKQIAEVTGLTNYVFSQNFVHDFLGLYHFADGNALIGNYQFQNTHRLGLDRYKRFSLSSISEVITGSKSILSTTINYKNQDITVICTHLSNWDTDFFTSEKETDAELEAVFRYTIDHAPAIILGDLNTLPDRKPVWNRVQELLHQQPQVSLQYDPRLELFSTTAISTFPATSYDAVPEEMLGRNVTSRINGDTRDYIFVVNDANSPLQLDLSEVRIINDKYYSDHAPGVGKIKINWK